MLDFHAHILPGLDDGAPDMETALEMARIAVEDGITAMVAAPHFIEGSMENYRELVWDRVRQFQQALDAEGIPLRMIPGSEVYLSPETPGLIKEGRIMTINDAGKHVLVEFPMHEIPRFAERIIFEINLLGVTPVFAHPERNAELARNPGRIMELAAKGSLIQINSGSITGLYGKKIMKTARLLVENDLVHLIGSDAHSARGRAPRIQDAYQYIERLRPGKAKEIVENSQKIIAGIDVCYKEPVQGFKKAGGFWRKIRNLKLIDKVLRNSIL